jgi:short-subunit dehydrogenase involved in D-alanine esterification of teichoic acids
MPGTFNAVYNASKAFVQSFAQAVRDGIKDTGVTITALIAPVPPANAEVADNGRLGCEVLILSDRGDFSGAKFPE